MVFILVCVCVVVCDLYLVCDGLYVMVCGFMGLGFVVLMVLIFGVFVV